VEDAAGASAPVRRFANQYARLHPSYVEVRTAFAGSGSLAGWQQVLERFYA
jgi:ABC-type molybdate transport system substrate-binding protein